MKIPPLAQLAICLVFASILTEYLSIMSFNSPSWLVIVGTIAGLAFLIPAVMSFIQQETTVNPQSPSNTTSLVTSGIFGISRNPMYVGMLLMLLSFVLWLGEVSSFIAPIIFYISIDRFQIRFEEQYLHQKFGEAFMEYTKRTPRWLIVRNG